MLNYIIPPIVIILSLAALIFFIFRKSSEIPAEMISEERKKMAVKTDSGKKKLFKFTQLLLKITERGMQYFKLLSLKFYNKTDNWFHSVREKRVNRINGVKKIETENLISLIKNDWKISFKADQFGKYGMTSVAIFNLVINYLFCLGISYTIINTTNFFCKNKI